MVGDKGKALNEPCFGEKIDPILQELGRQDALSLWEEVPKLPDIYDFDSTQSAEDLVNDLKEILYNARKGNV